MSIERKILDYLAAHGESPIGSVDKGIGCQHGRGLAAVRSMAERGVLHVRKDGRFEFVSAVAHETGDIPIEELIEQRKRKFSAVAGAAGYITVRVPGREPIGIWHCGDPHVDDDGCDLESLHAHADTVRRTPRMYAGSVGDMTNNWVGRMARLYGQQSTSARDGWRLAEDLIRRCEWLYLVAGNHDAWSGDGDPIQWIARLCGQRYSGTSARLRLVWDDGSEMRLHVRHSFPGNSQWNAAHGVAKAAQLGADDDLLVAGHTHVCGYQVVGHDSGRVTHCLQVGSYKTHDRYAREMGLPSRQAFAPSAVTILDPRAAGPGRVVVLWDVERASRVLGAML